MGISAKRLAIPKFQWFEFLGRRLTETVPAPLEELRPSWTGYDDADGWKCGVCLVRYEFASTEHDDRILQDSKGTTSDKPCSWKSDFPRLAADRCVSGV